MLRSLLPAICLLAFVAPALASGKSPGAYANLQAASANACAHACSEDGLCMAWTFHQSGACELTAIIPAGLPQDAAAFGLASRAPALPNFVNAAPAPFEPPAPTAALPVLEDRPRIALAETDESLQLLGGPEEGDLRPTLSARQ